MMMHDAAHVGTPVLGTWYLIDWIGWIGWIGFINLI
jgi:hypothetical protein